MSLARLSHQLLLSSVFLASVIGACSGAGGNGSPDGGDSERPPATGGKPIISLGIPVSGTVDTSDDPWYVIGPPPRNGYQDTYQIEATAGTTFTVNCVGNTVEIRDADSFGEFTASSGTSSVSVDCLQTPATWLPQRSGTATINVLALADEVPTTYSVTFSK